MIAYVKCEVSVHGLGYPTVEEFRAKLEDCVRSVFGHRLDGDIEVEVIESVGIEEPHSE